MTGSSEVATLKSDVCALLFKGKLFFSQWKNERQFCVRWQNGMPFELCAMEHGSELTGTEGSGSSEPSGYQKGCKCNT